ncbi:MAG: homoserine O-acetyltransferase [Acidobacteriota bacterium]|nr:homoserine O-acetyltransferase [Acidobacteriota bacterium]
MSTTLEPTFEGDFTFARDVPFELAAGGELRGVTLRYAIYGELNTRRDNAILVCHALSGSARVADWWPQMFGHSGAFDLTQYCVIGVNVIGSCYGSTGPTSINPLTGDLYRETFPLVSIRDMLQAQKLLIDHLGIERLHAVVGGSIGGMQALQWAVDFNERIERCIAIGATPLSAMGLALNHLQRQAIQNDPQWRGGSYDIDDPPVKGLALARAIAMCSYKSSELFSERFGRRPDRGGEDPFGTLDGRFDVAGYLDYQGASFTGRFDANTYLVISKAMDTFELASGYASEREALRGIGADVLLVGISSDWLFPADDVRTLYKRMKLAGVEVDYTELKSSHGHDAFLADAEVIAPIIKAHLAKSLNVPTTLEAPRALKVSHAS